MMVAPPVTSTHDRPPLHHLRHFAASSPSVPTTVSAPASGEPLTPPRTATGAPSHGRRASTSPTHSSPSSSGSAVSLLRYSAHSTGSGSWVGSDGTGATSEGVGSPATSGKHKEVTDRTRAPGADNSAPRSSPEDRSAERLKKSASVPVFRGPGHAQPQPIKRKASGGSSSARAEVLEGRNEEMRRVTPEPTNPLVEGDQDADQTMREATRSPDGGRKLRRKKAAERAAAVDQGIKMPKRKRKPRIQPIAMEPEPEPEEEEHIDLTRYPQETLLRLLASLLQRIATANDNLRPIAGIARSMHGSTASLASAISAPGSSMSRRVARAQDPEYQYQYYPSEDGYFTPASPGEHRTPWNSMPSSPYSERPPSASLHQSLNHGVPTVVSLRRATTLSRPPTPGASRPVSPIVSRRNSSRQLPALTSVASPPDDAFTASRAALDSPSATLAFHARVVPQISVEAYLLRILKYCPTSNEVFLSLLVYFDRMARMGLGAGREPCQMRGNEAAGEVGEVKTFAIDSYNVHRLVIAGVTVASKFFSDVFYTNARYAKVGGLPLHELDALELQFLLLNDFRLMIPLEEMQRYADQLLMHWEGAQGTLGYRPPRPPRLLPRSRTLYEPDDGEYDGSGSDGGGRESDDGEEGGIRRTARQGSGFSATSAASYIPTHSAGESRQPAGASSSSLTTSSQSHSVSPTGSAPGPSVAAAVATTTATATGLSSAGTYAGFHPGLPKSRPSSSGMSIASAQSSEASASTITPGTPRQGRPDFGDDEEDAGSSGYEDSAVGGEEIGDGDVEMK